jgi:hypothetical protein
MKINIKACAFEDVKVTSPTSTGGLIQGSQFESFTMSNCLTGLTKI